MKRLKVAVFTSFLDNIGGAEHLTLVLARELGADIYTTNINHDMIDRMGFSGIHIESIGNVPLNPPFRQQLTFSKFRRLNLKKTYDLYIIAGDWAISAAMNNKPNIEYFHSPINEIWEFKGYVRSLLEPWKRPIFDFWVMYNRFLYRRYFKNVEQRICNSTITKKRIVKFLGKDSTVIYPPVETKRYRYDCSGNFWLAVNRLTPHKRVEMQLNAFRGLPDEKLVIVGSYEKGARHFEAYLEYLKTIKPPNVEFRTWVTHDELLNLYATCKGFITTAKNEDFGMTPLEAMASGKPVIASNEGGYIETVIHNETGILIDNIDAEKLKMAIDNMSNDVLEYKHRCFERAKEFDTSVFISKMRGYIHMKTGMYL